MSTEQNNLSGPMAVLCIVNGMIGGLILILPVMALQAGWLLTLLTLLITGFVSYYSSFLCVLHTGNEADLDIAIQKHFWGSKKIKTFYELCIFCNLMLLDILYYELIVLQWIGLAPPHQFTSTNPMINFVVLLVMVLIIKFKDFGASLMAYGIVSIAAYLLFVTWVVGSEDAKNDQKQLQLFGANAIDLAAALGQAFAIQSFFIPVLKKNNKPHKHKLYTLMSFVLGGFAYAYIAFMGSYGILHRQFVGDSKSSKTIEGYFQTGTWQVNAIEVIYLVHLYSVFPEYLLISKKRFFSIFGLQESQVGTINRKEVIYILSILGFCLGMAILRISLRQLIQINGAIIGFFFIYFFPVGIHFKCAFIKHDQINLQSDRKIQQPDIKYDVMIEEKDNNKPLEEQKPPEEIEKPIEIQCNTDDKQSYQEVRKPPSSDQSIIPSNNNEPCEGSRLKRSKCVKYCQISFMVFMLILGFMVLLQGLAELFKGKVQE